MAKTISVLCFRRSPVIPESAEQRVRPADLKADAALGALLRIFCSGPGGTATAVSAAKTRGTRVSFGFLAAENNRGASFLCQLSSNL